MHILMPLRGDRSTPVDAHAADARDESGGEAADRTGRVELRHVLEAIRVPLRALAQLVFAERADAGVLVLAAIGLLAPWSALTALLAAAFGSAAGFLLPTYSRAECKAGLAGFNCAIIGILWGGFVASGAPNPLLLVAVLILCLILEAALKAALRPFALPPLSMPAVATAMIVSLALAPGGTWFWVSAGAPPLGTTAVYLAILCVLLAAASKHQTATLQALILGVAAMWLAAVILGHSPLESAGLWAFAVAPASFAVQALFVPGIVAGAVAGLLAAVLAAALWLAWSVVSVLRRHRRTPWLQPAFWHACLALAHARRPDRSVVALTGGKLGEAVGVPDYVSGGWRDPELPASAYSQARFESSLRCRRICWQACETLRERARTARPSAAHRSLATMSLKGMLDVTLTTSVDALHRVDSGTRTVALFGELHSVTCLACGDALDWPPARVWQRWDLHCPSCGGLLKPGVTFPGDDIAESLWTRARALVMGASVLLVIGHPRSTPVDEKLIELARRWGARIVFINQGPIAHALHCEDLVIVGPIASVLRAFTWVLAVHAALSGRGQRKSPATGTPQRGARENG
jgi:NAD-dependent deacetylase